MRSSTRYLISYSFLTLPCKITVWFYFAESYKPPFPFTRKEDWYHGKITRQETERRLREGSANHTEGTFFLVRQSSSKPGFYALSMLFTQRVFHFEVGKRGQYYFIDYGPYLESLEHVVGHYMNHADGLPAELQRPIKPPHPVVDDNIRVFRIVRFQNRFPFTIKILIYVTSIANKSHFGSTSPSSAQFSSFAVAKYQSRYRTSFSDRYCSKGRFRIMRYVG